MKQRVVVTGMGMVTPLGTGVDKNWQAVCQGQSGIGPITRFDASTLKCQIAGEVKDFHPGDFMKPTFIKHFDLFVRYAMASSMMAMEDSKLTDSNYDKNRLGVTMGTASGTCDFYEICHNFALQGDLRRVPAYFALNLSGNLIAGTVALEFGARGPNHCLMEACAAGATAIGLAFRHIQWGEADMMIAGGSDGLVTPTGFASLDNIGALTSKRNDRPEEACRPFDEDRDGFILSEGGAVIVLEAMDKALARGAKIYGEITGYGNNSDAYHVTTPNPTGETQAQCMKLAIQDAGIAPEEIDYINAHGTSTILNDVAETKAIKLVFGEHAKKVVISSNKSMIGHLMGAAGSAEAIFSLLTLQNGIIPPTINLDKPDTQCDLDYVPLQARKVNVNTILSNSFGFGGVNGTLIFKKFSE